LEANRDATPAAAWPSRRANQQRGLAGRGSDIVNDWSLKLGNVPMTLTVDAGAYQAR